MLSVFKSCYAFSKFVEGLDHAVDLFEFSFIVIAAVFVLRAGAALKAAPKKAEG